MSSARLKIVIDMFCELRVAGAVVKFLKFAECDVRVMKLCRGAALNMPVTDNIPFCIASAAALTWSKTFLSEPDINFSSSWHQNRRQKVFNRAIYVCAWALDIENLIKIPLVYSVSYFTMED